MTFRILHQPALDCARSPFRIVEQATGREIDWANRYLDTLALRRMAPLTLRGYAQALLHFLRWWESIHHTPAITPDALTDSLLLDYVRFQSGQQPPPAGCTINQRVAVLDRALRDLFPQPCPTRSSVAGPLLAASSHGAGQTCPGAQPHSGERRKTHHRSALSRRGAAILD